MKAKPESTITSQKLRASNLFVLVESEIKHKIFLRNLTKRKPEAIFFKCARKMIVFPIKCSIILLISAIDLEGIPQKFTLRDEISRGQSPRDISSLRVIFWEYPE
jgi:hypothetical protein